MSISPGCCAFDFARADLPVSLFGEFDAAASETARRQRFLRRRADSEFLEKVVVPVSRASASPPPVDLRRSRRVLGLPAECDLVEPPRCRRKFS